MEHRYIKKNWAEKKGNYATMPIDIKITEASSISPEESHIDNLIDNSEEHNAQKGHIAFLILLTIGMILQLTANPYCLLTGTVLCLSVCGFICSWVFFSAVLSHSKSKSLSGTL